jgi:hypothetical protein
METKEVVWVPEEYPELLVDVVINASKVLNSDGSESDSSHEHTWGGWVDVTPEDAKWEPHATDQDKETKWVKQVATCTTDSTSKKYQWRETTTTQDKEYTTTLPSISPVNVDTRSRIAACDNTHSDKIHGGSFTAGEAVATVDDLLPRLRNQAEALRVFFNGATTNSPGLTAKFTTLKNVEATLSSGTTTLQGRVNTMESNVGTILDTIFGDSGADRETFNKWFDAYQKGQYLISRDWQTEWTSSNITDHGMPTAATTAQGQFTDALDLIGKTIPAGKYDAGRGNIFQFSGGNDSLNDYFTITLNPALIAEMKTQILAKLGLNGLTGAQLTNANAMAEALIIQLGQDHKEITAFYDDLVKETGFGVALAEVAQANSQSDIKLAAVNPVIRRGVSHPFRDVMS